MTFRIKSHLTNPDIPKITNQIYPLIFRYNLSSPGFCVIDLGTDGNSQQLKSFMIDLKKDLECMFYQKTKKYLNFLSLESSSRKYTTKYHLEATPCNESLLILGYEPTIIKSCLYIRDYTKFIQEKNYDPKVFFRQRRDFVEVDSDEFKPYTATAFTPNDSNLYRVVVINNSFYPGQDKQMLGVMHKAEVFEPQEEAVRIINTLAVGVFDNQESEPIEKIENFIHSSKYNVI